MIDEKTDINFDIPDNVREFFEQSGINIDELFPSEVINESNSEKSINDLVIQIRELEKRNNQHKLLIISAIVDLRKQIKAVQSSNADILKSIERNFKKLTARL